MIDGFVCMSAAQIEDRVLYLVAATTFVYLVVRAVWNVLDRKFPPRCDVCRSTNVQVGAHYGGQWIRCRDCRR